MASLKTEKLIQCSPKGQRVKDLLEYFETKMFKEDVAEVATMLLPRLSQCIAVGSKHKLPLIAQGAVWSAFHQLRQDEQLNKSWNAFISKEVPQSCQKESQLAFQLLLDRLLKRLIQNKAQAQGKCSSSSGSGSVRPLTAIESNAIRYMAGYVAVSLLKKYDRPTRHKQLKIKRKYFVRVLQGMKAVEQPEAAAVDSVLDYSRVWSELIDRGGLYHISDEVGIVSIVTCTSARVLI